MFVSGHRVMSETGFRKTWKALLAFIVTTRSMTDLCWTCQKNNTRVYIYRSTTLPEAENSERVLQQERHLMVVQRGAFLVQRHGSACEGCLPRAGNQ